MELLFNSEGLGAIMEMNFSERVGVLRILFGGLRNWGLNLLIHQKKREVRLEGVT